ncbi:MAG: hypothetical protein U0136_04810 [Bdellovibrionota bacterium]
MPGKGPITIVGLLCVAFLWGYSKDSLLAKWAGWQSAADSAPVPQAQPVVPPATNVPEQKRPQVAPPPIAAMPAAVNRPPQAGLPLPTPSPGAALANTLDSIRPGQIEPQQITQRNAYFEKLSQQLKELQGGGPTANGTPGVNTPPAPNDLPPPPPAPPGAVAPLPPGYPDPGAMQQQPPGFDARVGLEQVTPEVQGEDVDDPEPDESDSDPDE